MDDTELISAVKRQKVPQAEGKSLLATAFVDESLVDNKKALTRIKKLNKMFEHRKKDSDDVCESSNNGEKLPTVAEVDQDKCHDSSSSNIDEEDDYFAIMNAQLNREAFDDMSELEADLDADMHRRSDDDDNQSTLSKLTDETSGSTMFFAQRRRYYLQPEKFTSQKVKKEVKENETSGRQATVPFIEKKAPRERSSDVEIDVRNPLSPSAEASVPVAEPAYLTRNFIAKLDPPRIKIEPKAFEAKDVKPIVKRASTSDAKPRVRGRPRRLTDVKPPVSRLSVSKTTPKPLVPRLSVSKKMPEPSVPAIFRDKKYKNPADMWKEFESVIRGTVDTKENKTANNSNAIVGSSASTGGAGPTNSRSKLSTATTSVSTIMPVERVAVGNKRSFLETNKRVGRPRKDQKNTSQSKNNNEKLPTVAEVDQDKCHDSSSSNIDEEDDYFAIMNAQLNREAFDDMSELEADLDADMHRRSDDDDNQSTLSKLTDETSGSTMFFAQRRRYYLQPEKFTSQKVKKEVKENGNLLQTAEVSSVTTERRNLSIRNGTVNKENNIDIDVPFHEKIPAVNEPLAEPAYVTRGFIAKLDLPRVKVELTAGAFKTKDVKLIVKRPSTSNAKPRARGRPRRLTEVPIAKTPKQSAPSTYNNKHRNTSDIWKEFESLIRGTAGTKENELKEKQVMDNSNAMGGPSTSAGFLFQVNSRTPVDAVRIRSTENVFMR